MIYILDTFSARGFQNSKKTIAIRCMDSRIASNIKQKGHALDSSCYTEVLPLVFDDVNLVGTLLSFGRYTGFTKRQANKIGDFLEQHYGSFEDIAVHCYAGIERSFAVGKALGDHFNLEYQLNVFGRPKGNINQRVYNTLSRSLKKRFPDRVLG